MIFARKPGKLTGEVIKIISLSMGIIPFLYKKTLNKFSNYSIVDDLIDKGETLKSVSNLLKIKEKMITGALIVLGLRGFNVTRKFDFPIESTIIV